MDKLIDRYKMNEKAPRKVPMPVDAKLLYETVRHRIKDLRTAETDTRLSQDELGQVLGVKRSTIANIESGAQRASLHNVYALCAHYHLELADVLPSVADMQRRSARLGYTGIEPGLSSIIEKLKRRG